MKNDQEIWQAVTSFTDQHIQREEVRYINVEDTTSAFDVFKVFRLLNNSFVEQFSTFF